MREENCKILLGFLVIINAVSWRKWSIPSEYLNMKAVGSGAVLAGTTGIPAEYVNTKGEVMRFPGISSEGACELVIRKICAIGIDTLSLDSPDLQMIFPLTKYFSNLEYVVLKISQTLTNFLRRDFMFSPL